MYLNVFYLFIYLYLYIKFGFSEWPDQAGAVMFYTFDVFTLNS